MRTDMDITRFAGTTIEERKLVLRWWHRLWESGEMGKTFQEGQRDIVSFIAFLSQPTTTLYYAEDPVEGIVFAVWCVPFMRGGSIGGWVAPSIRKSLIRSRLAKITLSKLFAFCPILLAIARPTSVELMKRVGFQVVGDLPTGLSDTPSTVLCWLDEEHFHDSILGKMEV